MWYVNGLRKKIDFVVHLVLPEYDPESVWGSGKRRRRNSGASCESRSKDRRSSAETASSAKGAGATQKQVNCFSVKASSLSDCFAITESKANVAGGGGGGHRGGGEALHIGV
jgi:hypothetical protein